MVALQVDTADILDFIGIGFGPSNLAVAIVAKELDSGKTGRFFERNSTFHWHAGMMLEDSRMRISFLKDLATLRNPASPYTFLQYTKAKGRLERFVNLREFHPTRLEYQNYLKWVAEAFSDQVQYGATVRKVTAVALNGEARPSVFRLQIQEVDTRQTSEFFARNIVYASGGTPRLPEECFAVSPRIIHSSAFLDHFPKVFEEGGGTFEFAVAGDGQSAGEIVARLLLRYPAAHIHWFVSGYGPRPVDDSPFVNEATFFDEAAAFYLSDEARRRTIRDDLRNTNYGAIDLDLLNDIYRHAYADEVRGGRRLFVHRYSKLVSARENAAGVEVMIEDRAGGPSRGMQYDGVVLATGYTRGLDREIFADMLPLMKKSGGDIAVSRSYQVLTTSEMDCRLYLQGYSEASHGLTDTLLSLLAFRSKEIFEDICKNSPSARPSTSSSPSPSARLSAAEYPPTRHVDSEPDRLYAVIQRYKFATLISVQASGEPIVTHIPLILDRSRGPKGMLFGHIDRANPHVDLLDGRKSLALFHGPNAYISPHVYETDQLPTWNSITVHVRGVTRLLSDRQAMVRGLMSICEQADQQAGAYRLRADDPRIERLLRFIVCFEIEIEELIGRFKLSQDRNQSDGRRAATELARSCETEERDFISTIVGYQL